jgi:hypothetical protein
VLANDLALDGIFVASDCKMVVSDIEEGSMGRYGSIIAEIRSCRTQFQEATFVYEGRAYNFEAHNLAKFALS